MNEELLEKKLKEIKNKELDICRKCKYVKTYKLTNLLDCEKERDRCEYIKDCKNKLDYYKANPDVYIHFGKFKFLSYVELAIYEKEYLAWLLSQTNLNNVIRIRIENILFSKKNRKEEREKYIAKNLKVYCSKNTKSRYYDSDLAECYLEAGIIPNGY